MRAVVLGVQPSVPAASQAHTDEMGVSTTALENQRDRVDTGGAAARGRDAARLATPVGHAVRASHPRWVPGSTSPVLTGQHVASIAHRLQAWRGTWAAPLPGHALVLVDQQRRVSTAGVVTEDGHAQERRGIAQGLSSVSAGDLWIADRHVCPRGRRGGIARREAAVLLRQPGQWPGERLGAPRRQGVPRRGPVLAPAMRVDGW